MKVTLVAVVLGLLVVGCDRSVDSDTSDTLAFGEEAMFQTTQVSDAAFGSGRGNGIAHDSTRHGRMLQILSDYLELSSQQVDSLHTYGRTLFSTLLDIRTRVHAGQIMREEARVEVRTA
ncbi:MAG: hypothetical protein OEM41_10560, partial [Ignavibacteria bacterium]|nr:hypothetical protein [Ignavibacteria bacterium]